VLQDQGKYEAAEAMNRRALEGSEKVLGKDHPSTLTSVSNLASVLQGQGKYEAVEAMNRRALEGSEKVLGKDHPSTLTSVYCLAHLLHHRHRYKEALPLYQRASSGYLATLGADHPTTLACLDHQSSLQQVLDQEASGNRRHASTDGSISITPSASRRLASSTSHVELTSKDHWWRRFKKKKRNQNQ
jgi:tetratricopeptide (TPR) repeat protein